jgi:hypothetical protein
MIALRVQLYRSAKKTAASAKSDEMGKALACSLWRVYFQSAPTKYFHNYVTSHIV